MKDLRPPTLQTYTDKHTYIHQQYRHAYARLLAHAAHCTRVLSYGYWRRKNAWHTHTHTHTHTGAYLEKANRVFSRQSESRTTRLTSFNLSLVSHPPDSTATALVYEQFVVRSSQRPLLEASPRRSVGRSRGKVRRSLVESWRGWFNADRDRLRCVPARDRTATNRERCPSEFAGIRGDSADGDRTEATLFGSLASRRPTMIGSSKRTSKRTSTGMVRPDIKTDVQLRAILIVSYAHDVPFPSSPPPSAIPPASLLTTRERHNKRQTESQG